MATQCDSSSDVLEDTTEEQVDVAPWAREYLAREVSYWIIQYRTDHGLTQVELGSLLGKPQPAIQRLEAARFTPSLETIRHICKTLGGYMQLNIDPGGWMKVDLGWEPRKQ